MAVDVEELDRLRAEEVKRKDDFAKWCMAICEEGIGRYTATLPNVKEYEGVHFEVIYGPYCECLIRTNPGFYIGPQQFWLSEQIDGFTWRGIIFAVESILSQKRMMERHHEQIKRFQERVVEMCGGGFV